MKTSILLSVLLVAGQLLTGQQRVAERHRFELGRHDFLLDGKPFQIISGEMHPARIPREYWRQRIRMAKAMGCNTIAAYVFWNYIETAKGHFDFRTESRDIAAFIRIARKEGLYVLLRPGPYVCAEWDFGGLPDYLLSIPDIKVRCSDARYLAAAKRYVEALAAQVKPLLVTHGGPILMVQVENEYGSYGNDQGYLRTLRNWWKAAGIDVPFYTADGADASMLEAGNITGAAIGLDPGTNEENFAAAAKRNPDVPAFSSETYPGWLTHWGEKWARTDTTTILREVKFLMDTKRSFNLYVIHGGTNFGFYAGANSGGDKDFEPDVTSYDYDAPVNEQGAATPKYMALRRLIGSYLGALPEIPAPVAVMSVPAFTPKVWSSVWDELPAPAISVQPRPFEAYGQHQGFMVYKTRLVGQKSGRLVLTDLHDYATVFLDGRYIGYLDRREGKQRLDLPATNAAGPELEILVEGMGHINFSQELIDRKGITDRVTLNGMTLMNWEVYRLPMDSAFMRRLKGREPSQPRRPGIFFRGIFHLDSIADTYIDLSHYRKGIVWVNGHNLGKYWEIGPQFHLYCPAPWLKKGDNEIIIFDQLQTEAAPVSGVTTLD